VHPGNPFLAKALFQGRNRLALFNFCDTVTIALALKYGDKATDARTALEILSTKVGLVLVVLGVMHFFNLFIFSKMRRRATLHRPPPIPTEGYVKLTRG